ncbi:uncharacterized protein UV8b_08174 [Ustilaginoidea virens]|uniref:Secreted protein n=1 Tax=Ustilaginoidea virens TaxID=1159556 RepID=A0A8E5HZ22_USTVR|nr:uncharacterized protein UV8b_08174 [Ustilaginoidea virens]QUC23933.1 hypothetical protein UV8b_08174 [Ustilaginoidea virens]
MHLLPSAALAVLLAAASPAAAQKYAPGKRNICVKENQKIGTPEIILWQGTDLCGGGVAKWPNSLPVGDKKVDPTVCCLDVHGYGNFYGVIQGESANCRYHSPGGQRVSLIIRKVNDSPNLYDVSVRESTPWVDVSRTPGRYICKAV